MHEIHLLLDNLLLTSYFLLVQIKQKRSQNHVQNNCSNFLEVNLLEVFSHVSMVKLLEKNLLQTRKYQSSSNRISCGIFYVNIVRVFDLGNKILPKRIAKLHFKPTLRLIFSKSISCTSGYSHLFFREALNIARIALFFQ